MGSHQSRRRRRRRPILRGHYGRREKTQKEYKRICSCFMIFPHSSQTKLPGRAHDRHITLRMSTLKVNFEWAGARAAPERRQASGQRLGPEDSLGHGATPSDGTIAACPPVHRKSMP
jgi:hypothetical protein